MATIFILPKQNELTNLTVNNNNSNFKIINPSPEIIVQNPRLNKSETAKNIMNEIEKLQPNKDEIYLLYHIGELKNLDTELKIECSNLTTRLYSSADGEVTHDKIKELIKEVCGGNIIRSVENVIKEFFYDKKLEAKLELLHACLTPEGYKTVTWDNEKVTIKELEKSFTGEIGNKGKAEFDKLKDADDGPFGENYINTLTELRNVLLEDY